MAQPARQPRADARRNQQRVLEAAEELFADKGVEVGVDEIAARAGVGIGTLYRHFPGGKTALLQAVVMGHLAKFVEQARKLSTGDDCGVALFTIVRQLVHLAVQKKDLSEELARSGIGHDDLAGPAKKELEKLLSGLWLRAQREGKVRPDVNFEDMSSLITATCMAAQRQGRAAVDRLVGVMCDGLRERGRHHR